MDIVVWGSLIHRSLAVHNEYHKLLTYIHGTWGKDRQKMDDNIWKYVFGKPLARVAEHSDS